jgi:hypothetical protein
LGRRGGFSFSKVLDLTFNFFLSLTGAGALGSTVGTG